MRGGKRPGAGRPKYSHCLPHEYRLDLRQLLDLWEHGAANKFIGNESRKGRHRRGHGIRKTCRHIIALGGVKWIDRETGDVVCEIRSLPVLLARLYESWRPIAIRWTNWRPTTVKWPRLRPQPRLRRHEAAPLVVARDSIVYTSNISEAEPSYRATWLRIGNKNFYK